MRSEFKGNLTQAAIHQLYEKQEARRKKKESGVMIGLKKKTEDTEKLQKDLHPHECYCLLSKL